MEDSPILRVDDQPLKEQLKREAERQALFHQVSNDKLGIPNGYKKVEVLLLRWDESIDEFPETGGEIDRLRNIFENKFNYGCKVESIRNLHDPQIDLHDLRLSAYVAKRIVDEETRLTMTSIESVNMNSPQPPTAFWEEAEKPLRNHASADVLAILDCCFASTAALKGHNNQTRAYHLLAAASAEGYTNGPGPTSFTTALCDSLEELLDESSGQPFPLVKLWERINTKPGQGSLPWDRLERHKKTFGNIELGRLEPDAKRLQSFQNTEPEQSSLMLRFSLKQNDLNNAQISKLAVSLPAAYKDAGIEVRRMDWIRFEQREEYLKRSDLLKRAVVQKLRSSVSAKRKRRNEEAQGQTDVPKTRRRARSMRSEPSLSKQPAQHTLSVPDEVSDSGIWTPPRSVARGRSSGSD
ncbi:hypothetical protein FB567DRAFT_454441 [Paraphoma chrysanthemicola]|uniref:Uncharacterized protein n=1 Tax=Paraphoma chrysanthemicola TaxID=798071 RepID=A0A8K0VSZ8_9PLEO|nr:hypothetical protein FB567DRAFT_454441 [Paraphoma chrysanthemicola]